MRVAAAAMGLLRNTGTGPIAAFLEHLDQVHQRLRASDGEGGNEDDAAARRRAVDHRRELLGRVAVVVQAIAIGRFHHQEVGAVGGHRRPQHRIVRPAEVAREQDRCRAVVEPHERGTGQVARRRQPAVQPRDRLEGVAEADRPQQFQAAQRVLACVQRQRRVVFRQLVGVEVLGFLFEQVARIGEQDAAEVERGRRAVHRAVETLPCQQRQIAAVVDVRMRQHDGVDVHRRQRQGSPIAQSQRLVALEQPAIDQQTTLVRAQQVFRTGDGVGRPEKLQVHGSRLRAPMQAGLT
jgi:CheY-like chemotaxis protein